MAMGSCLLRGLGKSAADGSQAAMDADPGGLRRDVEPSGDVGVGLVGDDTEFDGPALAVRELGERRGQVIVEAVEPGWVNAGRTHLQLELESITRGAFECLAAH